MSISEFKDRTITISYQGKKQPRQSVEYYAPNISSNVYQMINTAIAQGYKPSSSCFAEASDYEYFTFSYNNESVQLNINSKTPETIELSEDENLKILTSLENDLSTSITTLFRDLSGKPQLNQLPNLWFDLFCLLKTVLFLQNKDELWLNLILMFGKDAPMNTVYFSRIYPITLPDHLSKNMSQLNFVEFEIKDRNDENKTIKKTKLVIKDPVQKDIQISINARYAAPRVSEENPRADFLSMLDSALNCKEIEPTPVEKPKMQPVPQFRNQRQPKVIPTSSFKSVR